MELELPADKEAVGDDWIWREKPMLCGRNRECNTFTAVYYKCCAITCLSCPESVGF